MNTKFKVVILNGVKYPYKIDNLGNLYTEPNRYNGYKVKKIKCHPNHGGYLRCSLSLNGSITQRFIHRIVAELFIKNTKNLTSVNHKNGNKLDNSVTNLEWISFADNTHHAIDNNLIKSNINSKKVLEIKKYLESKEYLGKDIAKMFNVCEGTISLIKNKLIWK